MPKAKPQWWDRPVSVESNANKTLENAAKVLTDEAKEYRGLKNPDAAAALEKAAHALQEVAKGKTWTQAFKV